MASWKVTDRVDCTREVIFLNMVHQREDFFCKIYCKIIMALTLLNNKMFEFDWCVVWSKNNTFKLFVKTKNKI